MGQIISTTILTLSLVLGLSSTAAAGECYQAKAYDMGPFSAEELPFATKDGQSSELCFEQNSQSTWSGEAVFLEVPESSTGEVTRLGFELSKDGSVQRWSQKGANGGVSTYRLSECKGKAKCVAHYVVRSGLKTWGQKVKTGKTNGGGDDVYKYENIFSYRLDVSLEVNLEQKVLKVVQVKATTKSSQDFGNNTSHNEVKYTK